jgi:O-acetyl-ADP-ribose deacetylase (regulator of RNase III)
MIEPGSGNLLEAQVDALVNTVNTEGVMGKGLALQFKKAFPENSKAYEKACRAEEVMIGKMFVFDRGLLMPRWVINFPTKKHWRPPSRLSYVDDGLTDLIHVVRTHGIRSIAIPPLGCGNGGLNWDDVRPRIVRAFAALPDVRVLLYAPDGAPSAEAIIDRTAKPQMSPGRAAFLAVVAQYEGTGFDYRFSLLEAQKLAYFLHVAGDLERLEFVRHLYGPYCDALRNVLVKLEGHYTRGYGDANVKPSTPITLLPGAADEATKFLQSQPETLARLERVQRVIEGFETPFGMELLATVHWVATQQPVAKDLTAVIEAVHGWSPRKQKLMKPGHIGAAWNRLVEFGWLQTA